MALKLYSSGMRDVGFLACYVFWSFPKHPSWISTRASLRDGLPTALGLFLAENAACRITLKLAMRVFLRFAAGVKVGAEYNAAH